jgi:membrane-bound metal-dependent hydrolase YbcI (DUF457 family)
VSFQQFRMGWWRLAALLFTISASHVLLDAMNNSGNGVPLFWPLGGRYGNWGPIPVSDIAFELPDPRQSAALRAELLWVWLPTAFVVGMAMVYRRLTRTKK